jgi:hypothetical protein
MMARGLSDLQRRKGDRSAGSGGGLRLLAGARISGRMAREKIATQWPAWGATATIAARPGRHQARWRR